MDKDPEVRPTLTDVQLGAASAPLPERALQIAKHLFAEFGYDTVTLASIAELSACSEAELQKIFANKLGILQAIFEQGWARLGYNFQAIESVEDPKQKLGVLLDMIIAGLERDPEMKVIMLLEGRRVRAGGKSVMLTAPYLNFLSLVDRIILQMKERGQLKPGVHPQALRSALTGMFESLLRDQLLAHRMDFPARYSPDDVRKLFRLALDSFCN